MDGCVQASLNLIIRLLFAALCSGRVDMWSTAAAPLPSLAEIVRGNVLTLSRQERNT